MANENKNTNVILDGIFGILDRVFKDASGKLLAGRVLVLIVLFIMALVWVKLDLIGELWTKSRFESYSEVIQKERKERFDSAVKEQTQIVHSSSRSDMSAIYAFRPNDLNYFVDMLSYEGKLPDVVDPRNIGGFPIDKSSVQYVEQLDGDSFATSDPSEMAFIPSRKISDFGYMYSCPFFNLENVYSGTIEMYWYEPPKYSPQRLQTICNQSARVLGRIK